MNTDPSGGIAHHLVPFSDKGVVTETYVKVIEHLSSSSRPVFSFELLPPLRGQGIAEVYRTIEALLEFEPKFIDVTYHRHEYIYEPADGDLLRRVVVRKRPGTIAMCAAILHKYGVDAVPHLICGGFTREESEDALIELDFLGIDNVLALRGDQMSHERSFVPEEGGHASAYDLVRQMKGMNGGTYLSQRLEDPAPTDFCIGVAGYPEKHVEAPNLNADIRALKSKVEAGADYVVTQIFYHNEAYFSFVEQCKNAGITIPIIPGIKPISRSAQLRSLPRTFAIEIPDELESRIAACTRREEVQEVGIEWCIQQCRELLKFGVPCIHFYTMGNPNAIRRIARAIF